MQFLGCDCLKKKNKKKAGPGVAQWSECRPANQKVTGSIPSQVPDGLPSRSPLGGVQVSLPLFGLPFPSP